MGKKNASWLMTGCLIGSMSLSLVSNECTLRHYPVTSHPQLSTLSGPPSKPKCFQWSPTIYKIANHASTALNLRSNTHPSGGPYLALYFRRSDIEGRYYSLAEDSPPGPPYPLSNHPLSYLHLTAPIALSYSNIVTPPSTAFSPSSMHMPAPDHTFGPYMFSTMVRGTIHSCMCSTTSWRQH